MREQRLFQLLLEDVEASALGTCKLQSHPLVKEAGLFSVSEHPLQVPIDERLDRLSAGLRRGHR